MPLTITTPVGIDMTELYQLRDSYGQVVTILTGTETLVAEVWRGGDQPVLFAPSATWEDPTTGKFLVTFLGSDTQGLEPGSYQVRVTVAGTPIPDSTLTLTSSPGTSAPLKAYCTQRDMADYFGAIDTLLEPGDQTGFARQRFKARQWTDRIIQVNRSNVGGPSGTGYGYGYGYTGSIGICWSNQAFDPILQGYLDQDLLIVTPVIVEANAKLALSYACERQIGPGDKESQWQRLAGKYRAEAESLATRIIAGIDLNGDGYADLPVINCGMASNRGW